MYMERVVVAAKQCYPVIKSPHDDHHLLFLQIKVRRERWPPSILHRCNNYLFNLRIVPVHHHEQQSKKLCTSTSTACVPGPDHVPNIRRPRAARGTRQPFFFFSVGGACVYKATQTQRNGFAVVFVRRQLADIPTAHAPHQTSRVAATISDSGGWLQKVNRLRRWPPAGSVLRCV